MAGLVVVGVDAYRDPIGYLHIVGEVENHGAQALPVQVVASLRDGSGAPQGDSFSYACLPLVPAGGKSGFRIDVRDQEAAITGWEVRAEGGTPAAANPLQATGTVREDELGHARVEGTVTNPGTLGAGRAKACVTFYLEDGEVGDVAFAPTEPADLPPGGSAAFAVRALRDHYPFAGMAISAQGTDA